MNGRILGLAMTVAMATTTAGCVFDGEDGSEDVASASAEARARRLPSAAQVKRARAQLKGAIIKAKAAKLRARLLNGDYERKIDRSIRRLEKADDLAREIERAISSGRLRTNSAPITSKGETMDAVGDYNDDLTGVAGDSEQVARQLELERQAEARPVLHELGGMIQDLGDAIIP